MNEMRVSQAVTKITELCSDITMSRSQLNEEVRKVLDMVWMGGYSDGYNRLFGDPKQEVGTPS